jgi:hypothetical protein
MGGYGWAPAMAFWWDGWQPVDTRISANHRAAGRGYVEIRSGPDL